MGLDQDEVRDHLDRFIAGRAAVSRAQVDQWMKDALPILTAPYSDVQEPKGRVRKLAADRRMASSFSSHILESFLKVGMSTSEAHPAPIKQQPAQPPNQEPVVKSNGNGSVETKEFTAPSAPQKTNPKNVDESSDNGVDADVSTSGTEGRRAYQRSTPDQESKHAHGTDASQEHSEPTQESTETKDSDPSRSGNFRGQRFLKFIVAVLVIFGVLWVVFGPRKTLTQVPPTPTPAPNQQTPTPTPSPSESPSPEGMALIKAPGAGGFYMGRDDSYEDERPAHWEPVGEEFYMDKFEVSVEKYKECVDKGLCKPPMGSGWDNDRYREGTARLPVTGVIWEEAFKYCKSIGKRLPTEVEWEYAARGADSRRLYPWGEVWMQDRANTNTDQPTEVSASKAQTDSGLHDLIGNVWEWMWDKYHAYRGRGKSSLDRKREREDLHMIRGGCYKCGPVTATFREALPANGDQSSYAQTGFRCVQSVSH
jgi:formylglycine-generating enzyme required for sulfatase activity